MTAFSTLNVLPAAQLENLNELGYLEMTPVQAAALPAILAGKDVRVQAKTGSGKTAAFGLGLLQHIDAALFQTQSLVLCPTRELADQVAGELRRLARFLPNTKILTLCGGQPFGAQRDSLQHAPHIIVATPGRLLDHLQKGTVSLEALNTLVMDEADRMLDMGFSDAIDDVIRFAPASRQTLLFSATWPEAIAAISGRVQQNPLTIEIDTVDALPAIEQQFFETSSHGKIPLLQKLLSQHQPASCVVFCNTKKDCQAVCDALNAAGQSALSLHGDLEQRDLRIERAAEVFALQADLVVLAGDRVEQAAAGVEVALRLEDVGIAGVDRVGLVQVVDHPGIAGDVAGDLVAVGIGVGLVPVQAPAEDHFQRVGEVQPGGEVGAFLFLVELHAPQ
ncbi:MAG: DEAD/DEAH box helicase, partial [Citrobacter freundii]|nr:DEAD/DEAH box helicase [Citrobacter freundii]